jgi:hypothetical protein
MEDRFCRQEEEEKEEEMEEEERQGVYCVVMENLEVLTHVYRGLD